MAKRIRNNLLPMTIEEWRNSPESDSYKAKLTEEEAQRIIDEAIAGGTIWDVQEKINARRRAELQVECGVLLD